MRALGDLVDSVRQHTAGAGADAATLALLIEASNTSAADESTLQAALSRLVAHLDAIDEACTGAVLSARDAAELRALRESGS